MSTREPTLTSKEHLNMDSFLGYVLEDFKDGRITKSEAIGGLAHVIAAIDKGNYGEAINWFEQGRRLIRATR